jgi:hypothetical protein
MRILSRILITVFVLPGVAFAVMLSFSSCQHEGNYAGGKAGGKPGCGAIEYKFGVDNSGSDSLPVDNVHFDNPDNVASWLTANGVSNQCYKIRFWKKEAGHWHWKKDIGGLGAIQLITKKGPKFPGPDMTATSGSGGTQRVMFNSTNTRDAFKKYIGQ